MLYVSVLIRLPDFIEYRLVRQARAIAHTALAWHRAPKIVFIVVVVISFVVDHLEHSTTCASGMTTLAKASSAAGTSTLLLFVMFRRSRDITLL